MNNPLGRLYRHYNWSLIVRIDDNWVITQIISEPTKEETLWPYVREAWIQMIRDKRTISEEERDCFIPIN